MAHNDRHLLTGALMAAAAILIAATLPFAGAANDTSRGKQLFEKRCSGCHSADRDMEGPRLGGVFGRHSGTVPSFPYSDALKNAQITWDAVALDRWLTDPDKLVPDTDMAFRVEKANERAEIIRYLQQLPKK
ncbi:MAG TPA: c-type cytochrome [Bryobacteraceae bacterium]|jgi:cytochrome c|nr:c-type cytochrome [Bryobacteraceae bacterium]